MVQKAEEVKDKLPGLLSAPPSRDIIAVEALYFGHFVTTAADDVKDKNKPAKQEQWTHVKFYPEAPFGLYGLDNIF